MTVGVASDGAVYFDRFNGWYKTAPKTLDRVLRAGCYNDANPQPVSSVKLALAPNAPKKRVNLVFSILEKEGWSREKVNVQPWNNDPHKPR